MKKFKKCFDKFIWSVTGTTTDNVAYKIISFFSLLIRVVFLPYIVTLAYKSAVANGVLSLNLPTWLIEAVARLVIGANGLIWSTKLLNIMAYQTVGCFYSRGKNPVVGSLFYNLFYSFYQLMLIFLFGPFGWWGYWVTIGIYYLICCVAFSVGAPASKELQSLPNFKDKSTYPKNWKVKTVLLCLIAVVVVVAAFLVQLFIYRA